MEERNSQIQGLGNSAAGSPRPDSDHYLIGSCEVYYPLKDSSWKLSV